MNPKTPNEYATALRIDFKFTIEEHFVNLIMKKDGRAYKAKKSVYDFDNKADIDKWVIEYLKHFDNLISVQ